MSTARPAAASTRASCGVGDRDVAAAVPLPEHEEVVPPSRNVGEEVPLHKVLEQRRPAARDTGAVPPEVGDRSGAVEGADEAPGAGEAAAPAEAVLDGPGDEGDVQRTGDGVEASADVRDASGEGVPRRRPDVDGHHVGSAELHEVP